MRFQQQIPSLFIYVVYVCRPKYPTYFSKGSFWWNCLFLCGAITRKNHTSLCVGIKQSHTTQNRTYLPWFGPTLPPTNPASLGSCHSLAEQHTPLLATQLSLKECILQITDVDVTSFLTFKAYRYNVHFYDEPEYPIACSSMNMFHK